MTITNWGHVHATGLTMAKGRKQENTGWLILGGLGLLLLWLLSKGNSLLHESVSSSILTPYGTVTSDPVTGAPQYDPSIAASIPQNEEAAIPPICGPGAATFTPSNPKACSCPQGYTLWKNVRAMIYECIPS